MNLWNLYTERARNVVLYAQQEAETLEENFVSPEHLLLGLLRENDSVAGIILSGLGCDADIVRSTIKGSLSRGPGRNGKNLHLDARSKQVISFAHAEVKRLGNDYVGTEHLLLGVICEGRGNAYQALKSAGANLHRVRDEVYRIQQGAVWPPAPSVPSVEEDPSIQSIDAKDHVETVSQPASAGMAASNVIEGIQDRFKRLLRLK